MGGLNVLRGIIGGIDQAVGNDQGSKQMEDANARSREQKAQQTQILVAPLSQQLNADRLRLAGYVDPKTLQPLAGHEDDYNTTLNRMADTIGQIRGHMGNGAPAEDPNGLKMAAAKLLDKTHITHDLQGHLRSQQSGKSDAYGAQNRQAATAMGSGAVPPPVEPGPDAWQKFSTSYKEATGSEPPASVREEFARKQGGLKEDAPNPPAPKPAAPLEAGGVMYGVRGPDGREYLASDMEKTTTPPEVKELFKTVKAAQQEKQTEAQKKEQEQQDRFDKTQAAIESRFERSQANQGTWSVAEGTDGKTKLLNTKTGVMRDAPEGLHKSGYYTKNVAPLEAADMNISEYMNSGQFTGPGDLDLQHQFFTATQPATGFRMTKVQQDILHDSQSLVNKAKAGVAHITGGTIYSPEQRNQIANEARKAIAAKKAALAGSEGGPKTQELRKTQDGTSSAVDKFLKSFPSANQ